jgi:hypothetical protein
MSIPPREPGGAGPNWLLSSPIVQSPAKVQPHMAEQLKIPRRNNFVGPSSGNGRWKAVVLSILSAPFNVSEPLTNLTSSTFDPALK